MGVLGPVFRAYDPEQGRLVAIKLFRIDLPPERAHQLVAEFEKLIAADLTHPGIAAPIAAGLSDVSPFLAQDFVTADSLDTVVRLGPSSVTDVTRVASQLGSALAVGSALDIAHGALHPRDVLMSADDVRVTGLGITQALERIGFAAPTRRPYTAPERLAGARWNRRADVFSLAALVYELLSGRRVPGAGDLPADALSDVNGIDRSGVRRVLSRALAEDPDDRFDTALAFADALQDACGKKMKATARPAKSPKVDPDPALDEPWHFEETPASELPLLSDAILTADTPAKDVPVGRGPLPDDDLALPVGDAQPTRADLQISAEADDDGLALTAPDTSHGSMFKVVAAPGLSLASSEDDAIRPVVAGGSTNGAAWFVPVGCGGVNSRRGGRLGDLVIQYPPADAGARRGCRDRFRYRHAADRTAALGVARGSGRGCRGDRAAARVHRTGGSERGAQDDRCGRAPLVGREARGTTPESASLRSANRLGAGCGGPFRDASCGGSSRAEARGAAGTSASRAGREAAGARAEASIR